MMAVKAYVYLRFMEQVVDASKERLEERRQEYINVGDEVILWVSSFCVQ